MDSVRQSCRPKHQVLILKCYPKYQKGVLDVKPNPSELSYLLYYASTRRSKVQKVGAFLEKRTARDVWRGKIGNVQVTLRILEALIDKCPRDLPLYASSVLTILDTVLRSNELSLITDTLPAFTSFCKHQDPNLLAADAPLLAHYRDLVRRYALLATYTAATLSALKTPPPASQLTPSLILRWRLTGLQAVFAVVASDDLGTDALSHLDVVMPVILENLYAPAHDQQQLSIPDLRAHVDQLDRAELESLAGGGTDNAGGNKRRKSTATVESVDARGDGGHDDPLAAAANAEDADRRAEVEVRALALRCLMRIFSSGSNTAQIRNSTALILGFVVAKEGWWGEGENEKEGEGEGEGGCRWGKDLLDLIAKATPFQNRFIILVATMESLLNTPMSTRKMPAQLILASLVDGLLASENNLIGLSVMDALIGLLQHLLLLLRVSFGKTKSVLHRHTSSNFVHPLQTKIDSDGLARDTRPPAGTGHARNASSAVQGNDTPLTDPQRRAQLSRLLQQCIGHLVTHIYYSDQVADTVRMILSRIKPTTALDSPTDSEFTTSTTTTTGPGPLGDQTAPVSAPGSGSGSPTDLPQSERLFCFPEAHLAALHAAKNVLTTANSPPSSSNESRKPVPIAVWNDSQWLLREPNDAVQAAYVDALVAWLRLETTAEDRRVVDGEGRRQLLALPPRQANGSGNGNGNGNGTARPVTAGENTSPERLYRNLASTVTTAHRDRAAAVATRFLALLHVAVYDVATQLAQSFDAMAGARRGVLRLHLVLESLVRFLGMNAVRFGVPMVRRLQEEFCVERERGDVGGDVEGVKVSPGARKAVASLVHGYLWAVVQRFQLEETDVGREILGEIDARKKNGVWLRGVDVPALRLDEIDSALAAGDEDEKLEPIQTEAGTYRLFDNVKELVDQLEVAYNEAVASNKLANMPGYEGVLGPRPTTATSAKGGQPASPALPELVKEALLTSWSRDAVVAALDSSSLPATQSSLSNSRTGTNLGLSTGIQRGQRYFSGPSGAESPRPRAGTESVPASVHHHTPPDSTQYPAPPTAGRSAMADALNGRSYSFTHGNGGGGGENYRATNAGASRRGSMPDENRLSVSTSNTIRMNELRRVLSVVSGANQEKIAPARRQHTASSLGGNTMTAHSRRQSSSQSSAYSDHPSLISTHSNMPPQTASTTAPEYDAEQQASAPDVPPVPPLPPTVAPTGSQSSISRPSTAAGAALAPPQQHQKHRSNTIHAASSAASSPSRKPRGTGARLGSAGGYGYAGSQAGAADSKSLAEGQRISAMPRRMQPGGGAGRPNRTLSLGRRADVERLLNGLLDHADAAGGEAQAEGADAGAGYDDANDGDATTPAQRKGDGPQRPTVDTAFALDVSPPETTTQMPRSAAAVEGASSQEQGRGQASEVPGFAHNDAEFHLSAPTGSMTAQRKPATKSLLSEIENATAGGKTSVVRPPY